MQIRQLTRTDISTIITYLNPFLPARINQIYEIEKRKIVATTKIDQLTRDANNQIQLHISSTAIEAMVNLLKEKLDEKEKQKIIDSSINELSSVLKN